MKATLSTIFSLFFVAYLAIVVFTSISLSGFWSDVLFSVVLSCLAILYIGNKGVRPVWLNYTTKAMNGVCVFLVIVFLGINILNPFAWDTLKLRSFYYQSVNGRLFHAYFKPVGSYSGGYGNFWITETPKYFPFIERAVYYDRTVNHDFNNDTFEGLPIDNHAIVRNYILDEVIHK